MLFGLRRMLRLAQTRRGTEGQALNFHTCKCRPPLGASGSPPSCTAPRAPCIPASLQIHAVCVSTPPCVHVSEHQLRITCLLVCFAMAMSHQLT